MTAPTYITLEEAEQRSRVHDNRNREHVNADTLPVLQVDTLGEFLKLDLPPRELILAPILAERSLTMIHAWRGAGKTWMTLSLALAISGGGKCFDWQSLRPRRVLLIDGEMPAVTLQERLVQLIRGAVPPLSTDAVDNLRLLTSDRQPDGLPDLATPKGQQAIAPYVDVADVIIFDNMSTLFGVRENESDDLASVNAYLTGLRRAGKSVIVVHHQGKGGQQRGSSRKEDVLDLVLALKRPDDYDAQEGARFLVVVEKARGLVGAAVKTFEARLTIAENAAHWSVSDPVDPVLEEIQSLLDENKSQREIAKTLGMSPAWVNKMVQRLREAGGDA